MFFSQKYMKIKTNSNDDLLLKNTLNMNKVVIFVEYFVIKVISIIIIKVFRKMFIQIIYKMLYYGRIYVSENVEVNKQVHQGSVLFVTIGVF